MGGVNIGVGVVAVNGMRCFVGGETQVAPNRSECWSCMCGDAGGGTVVVVCGVWWMGRDPPWSS